MKKIIIEVGSTVTKVDLFNGEILERIASGNVIVFIKKERDYIVLH